MSFFCSRIQSNAFGKSLLIYNSSPSFFPLHAIDVWRNQVNWLENVLHLDLADCFLLVLLNLSRSPVFPIHSWLAVEASLDWGSISFLDTNSSWMVPLHHIVRRIMSGGLTCSDFWRIFLTPRYIFVLSMIALFSKSKIFFLFGLIFFLQ